MKLMVLSLAASLLAGGVAYADPGFNGIAALPGCSGALVRFAGQSMDADALILTNGHCIGRLGSYEVLVHEPYATDVTLYNADAEVAATYVSAEIVYGTMRDTDMAILRLDATYQEIKDTDNVDPLMLADERGRVGETIAIVSGLWEYTTTCELDGFVHAMVEGEWAWTDSLRFTDACETFGGTSGSPVISVETGEVVGVNNTGYEGGEPCSTNNPCEVDADGDISTIRDGSYGQQTFHLYSCIDEAFELDLGRADCALPIPRGVLEIEHAELIPVDECDGDGNFDGGETATLRVRIANDGPVALENTTLSITSEVSSLTLLDGGAVTVDAIAPWDAATVDVAVALDAEVADLALLDLAITASDAESADPEVSATHTMRVNVDDLLQSSKSDDVESRQSAWTEVVASEISDATGWSRELDADFNTAWHADDLGAPSDLTLTSPELTVGVDAFAVQFDHRFRFETSDGVHYDGGVVEISTDDGVTWTDASAYTVTPYGGSITDESGNILGGRQAFVDESEAWPERSTVRLEFGTRLAGNSVRLRFRLGTDAAASDYGWDIDNIEMTGIMNRPFHAVRGHDDLCGDEPPLQADATEGGCACNAGSTAPVGWMGVLVPLAIMGRRRRGL